MSSDPCNRIIHFLETIMFSPEHVCSLRFYRNFGIHIFNFTGISTAAYFRGVKRVINYLNESKYIEAFKLSQMNLSILLRKCSVKQKNFKSGNLM